MVTLAIEAAKEAGQFLLDNFGKVKTIHTKGDRNLATEIDQQAEEIIVNKIKSKYPAHGILAEEGVRKDLNNEYIWIIDPLDGTHNYIRDITIFGVSIGLVFNNQFILGVIYMPCADELYVGEEHNGAFKNNQRIYVSHKDSLKEASISFDSSIRYSPQKMLPALEKLSQEVFNVRMFGSSARILSYVAEGKLDAAVEYHDRPWDFAAGVSIIREAGGIVTDLGGNQPTYKTVGYITANQSIHTKIFQLLTHS